MIKHGLARFGQFLGNLCAGTLSDFSCQPEQPAVWDVPRTANWLLNNVRIVNVDRGELYAEQAILIEGKTFGRRLGPEEADRLAKDPGTAKVIDGNQQYLVPGMADLHCHLSLVSEYELKLSSLHYFDAQRRRNCEFALGKGCTTVRDSGGAYDMVHGLKDEIETNRLLGPRILPSYRVLTPVGGMWDINPVMNRLAEMLFGGRVVRYAKGDGDIRRHIEEVVGLGAYSVKIYLEEKPLFGGGRDRVFAMFDQDQVNYIRDLAAHHNKPVECHAMFLHGARMAILAGLHSIAHLTVDEPYSDQDAELMAKNGVAIVPTFGVGSYLAMHCGDKGYPDHPEYQFFRQMLAQQARSNMLAAAIEPLRPSYLGFYDFIWQEQVKRKMPGVGRVHPERCHGFGVCAPKSMAAFRKAGVRVGIGTDGGTGTCFGGALEIEFIALLRYGYSHREILRMATLGNMEILGLQEELGSIAEGKLADMLLVRDNPLDNVMHMTSPTKVFKEGRCVIEQ